VRVKKYLRSDHGSIAEVDAEDALMFDFEPYAVRLEQRSIVFACDRAMSSCLALQWMKRPDRYAE
jgi:hypothetical protein